MNPRPDNYDLNRPRRDFFNQPLQVNTSVVSLMLKDLVYQILKKIKNESYFKWPNKMGGYPHQAGIKICTTKIIKIGGIQPRTAKPCATI